MPALTPSFDDAPDDGYSDSFVPPPEPPADFDGPGAGGARGGQGGRHASGKGGRGYGNNTAQTGAELAEFGRKAPQNLEAEQGVLGGMMLSKDAIADVVEILRPEDFYSPAHQTIYETILAVYSEGDETDPLVVHGRLDRAGDIDRVGGASYLHTLVSKVPTAANAAYYADIVAEKAVLRRLVDAGTRIVQLGYNGAEGAEIETVVDRAQQEVFEIGNRKVTDDYSVLHELLAPTMDELDELAANGGLAKGVPTGFYDLDNLTNGLHAGQMIIIAARPGVGKSTFALDIMRSASINKGIASVLFSLEMSKSEIVMRILSAESEVRLSDMRAGRMDDAKFGKLVNRMSAIDEAPLYIDDSPNLTMMEIRSKARRLKQKHDLGLIVVDYLQLMSSGKRVESRQQEVSEFSRQLKLLAKECEVPLIAISQLNRGPESRTDKRPQVADLRESGSLEQDADMVILLYRPDSQDLDDPRAGMCDVILAKHRGGPIGTVEVAHQLHYSRFANVARGPEAVGGPPPEPGGDGMPPGPPPGPPPGMPPGPPA